jgi:hypothetical protein
MGEILPLKIDEIFVKLFCENEFTKTENIENR